MKEYVDDSSNIALFEGASGKLIASIECVVIVTEPDYQADIGGLVKIRRTETLRFSASAKSLRILANHFLEAVDEAELLEDRAHLSPSEGAK